MEEGEPRPWHIPFVYLVEAFLLQVSLPYFGGQGRDLKQFYVLLSFPRV